MAKLLSEEIVDRMHLCRSIPGETKEQKLYFQGQKDALYWVRKRLLERGL